MVRRALFSTILVPSLATVSLVGCGGIPPEPAQIITVDGIAAPSASAASLSAQTIFNVFQKRYARLAQDAIGDGNQSLSPSDASALAYATVEAGAHLQYQLCSDFFRAAGKQQQVLLFSKELITFLATTAAGAMGVAHVAPAAIAWVGLGGATAVTTANIYARNFLFSEDNVDAVQSLVLRAVAKQRDAMLADENKTKYDFSSAVTAIMDLQTTCEVQHITALVREAVKNGQLQVTDNTASTSSAFVQSYEAQLGSALNDGVPLAVDQFAALYWLYGFASTAPTPDQIKIKIVPILNRLSTKVLNADGSNALTASKLSAIRQLLAEAKPVVGQALKPQIDSWTVVVPQANQAARVAPNLSPPPAPGGAAAGPVPVKSGNIDSLLRTAPGPGRVSVGIVPIR